MEEVKRYQIQYAIYEDTLDEEMQNNIKYIMDVTGYTKEKVINSALQLGCKWHLKSQLNFIADYQLGENSRTYNSNNKN